MFNFFISIFKKNKGQHIEQKLCCLGCKHLFYWCDGSVGCDIELERKCISNGFTLRKQKEING